MPRLDLVEKLRPHRKLLVLAAEKAFNSSEPKLPDRAQFSKLIAVCSEASCVEEIVNYLRYQSHRQNAPWKPGFQVKVVKQIEEVLLEIGRDMNDEFKVEAWRLYATYLAREFAYVAAMRKSDHATGSTHGGGR